ncbi:MAG TPA: sulfatase-like hydrolase/transferase [Longimicrobium sp.]|nr:sulfatase-like hydrolase/transferase [Longimicrobium sp.]
MAKPDPGRGAPPRRATARPAHAEAAPPATRAAGARDAAAPGMKGMNVVMFITDQERAIQHFPPGWAEENLPGLTRLKRHGMTFNRAFTNSCMCSPARSTLMTGYFPAQHGVKYTLEEDMPSYQYPQIECPLDLPSVASVMKAAGYHVVYKGKWHLSKKLNPDGPWVPEDVEQYGWSRWNPPDAGANQDITQAGGGWPNHDGRFMEQEGPNPVIGNEGALEYLRSEAARQQPFFMVISMVNPHDVLFYPGNTLKAGYKGHGWFEGEIGLPASVDEDLSTKPSVQKEFLNLFNLTGALTDKKMQGEYLNFYGNLMKASDEYLVQVLDTLEATGLRDDTVVIRTSDHGEMGLAHGGLRQKNFNFYEESLRVPLVFSNRRLFRKGRESDALVSHVDFLPTLASLFGAPRSARARWQGVDYSSLLLGESDEPVQPYIVFTWDDWQAGQASGPYLPPPNHIVSIREERWKLARYYDANGEAPEQWEFYDLLHDPFELVNLAWWGYRRTEEQERELRRLKRQLAALERTRLRPLPTTQESRITQGPPNPSNLPSGSGGSKGGGGGKSGGKGGASRKATSGPRSDHVGGEGRHQPRGGGTGRERPGD